MFLCQGSYAVGSACKKLKEKFLGDVISTFVMFKMTKIHAKSEEKVKQFILGSTILVGTFWLKYSSEFGFLYLLFNVSC